MKKRLAIITLSALTLAACSGNNNEQQSKNNTNESEQTKQASQQNDQSSSKQSSNNKNTSNNNQNPSTEEVINNLTDEEKVALALFEPSVEQTVITANELLNGQYTDLGANSNKGKQLYSTDSMTLEPLPTESGLLAGAPSTMKCYQSHPNKGTGAVPIIAVSDQEVLVFGTQSMPTYDEIKDHNNPTSSVFSLRELYEKWGNQDYKQVASKIKIGQPEQNQMNHETSSSDKNNQEASASKSSSSAGTVVTRDNVIDLVEEYEGHYLDTDTYTYKEPARLEDGSWGFSFVDQSGDLAGSYIVSEDGDVTKYDEKGRPE
ncbi:hypothetical protein [Staphylococcus sp. 17KM0847]|uniref:hypothetical protein n=1 Tax=Staphylococcus sp. 17KM0847 TaxID=2583989 RepID=UPI0015DF9BE1|nr:hypothetical protein [Staphylococcus sp. 17KM0847]